MTISLNPLATVRANRRGFLVHRTSRNSGQLREARRGLRTEFRPFSRVLRLKSAGQSQPAKFRFPDHEMERPFFDEAPVSVASAASDFAERPASRRASRRRPLRYRRS